MQGISLSGVSANSATNPIVLEKRSSPATSSLETNSSSAPPSSTSVLPSSTSVLPSSTSAPPSSTSALSLSFGLLGLFACTGCWFSLASFVSGFFSEFLFLSNKRTLRMRGNEVKIASEYPG